MNDDQLKDLNYVSGYTALTKWVLSVSLQMEVWNQLESDLKNYAYIILKFLLSLGECV